MRLSFLILTHRRTAELRGCLESLERAGIRGRAEALIGFNGRESDTAELQGEIASLYPWARTAVLEKTGRSEARNALIPKTAGRVIYFLDDDAYVSEDFLARALATFDGFPEAPVIGGPNLGPPGASPFQRAVDFLLRSPLGAGPMRVRYRRKGVDRPLPGWCFMLSNFGVRREVFEAKGIFFPKGCSSAEENLFLFQVERSMGAPVFSPDLYVFHHRRKSLASFCDQVFTNGRGRAQITLAAPSSIQLVVLMPWVFSLYLLAAAVRGEASVWLAPAALYAAASLFEALRLATAEKDPAAAVRLVPLFLIAHLSYAVGMAVGAFSRKAVYAGVASGYPKDIRIAGVAYQEEK
jgi:GT2 family glycosyltransferase